MHAFSRNTKGASVVSHATTEKVLVKKWTAPYIETVNGETIYSEDVISEDVKGGWAIVRR